MPLPKKAQAYVDDIFNRYTENDKLELFDILHMYDTKKLCLIKNSGYHDSRHFELVGYNLKLKQKRKLGLHDSVNLDRAPVSMVRIFIDGSTMIKFNHPVPLIHYTQAVYYEYTKDNHI